MAHRIADSSKRVYYWEHLFIGGSTQAYLNQDAARWLIRDMARRYAIPIPHLFMVNQPRNQCTAWAIWGDGHPSLTFNIHFKSLTAMLLIHEMSHLIVGQYGYWEDSVEHDEIWLGVYVGNLNFYNVLPVSASIPSLTKYGFEFIAPGLAGPDQLWELDHP